MNYFQAYLKKWDMKNISFFAVVWNLGLCQSFVGDHQLLSQFLDLFDGIQAKNW